MEGTKPKRCGSKNILVILGFLFSLAVIALITVALTQNKPLPENVKYGIVLDAGSSHTNMYIYNWPAEKENDTGVVQQVEMCKVQGPGISGYAQNVEDVGFYLNQCMDKAQQVIPKEQQHQTPVYLGATAGMRLLRMESSLLADKVLTAVKQSLSSYPFDFQGARIITGQEEGAYGWITINYLLGKFNQTVSWLRLLPRREGPQETSGALDLGGASTQITFVPLNDQIESQGNSLHFRLYGKSYNVYTHSFLCYGKDQALRLKLVSSIQDAENGLLRDPCFHPGYEKDVNISEFFNTPCITKDKKSFPFRRLQIQGTGNYSACLQSIQKIFNTTYCPYSRCSFNGVFLPFLHGDFGAFSAFYFVMDFLNLTDSSLESVITKMQTFCSQPWEEVKAQFPNIKVKYLSEYCFSGTYILALLQLGYGFTEDNWKNIEFMGKISGSDAGWTLGYMLNLTNMIPAEQPLYPPLPHSTYIFLMVLFSLLLAAVFFIGWLIFRKPSCLQKGAV
ncbi:ectonucleoside triphosphate diphosphohydrolase 1 isoform X3 [Phascolarctos cinereus]|uniref:Ectonucleoside triphosphate diphosphohydrolase 1 n=1 Tax=Phascolarctos cinereus TaxID=38626 RepID=A0A6P5L2Y2_PHACI|nr:ectonucleoside triphosphate diphosphohydrolase 1 isoform X3 [Phascolarctos cinereus]